jgi:hypothetical protein
VTPSIRLLHAASDGLTEAAIPIISALGIDAAAIAIALTHAAMRLLLQSHPKGEVVRWFRHQADQLDETDVPSAGGHA